MNFTSAQLGAMSDRALSLVDTFVVHHTAGRDMDIEEIQREEIAAQGFLAVGYHAVIRTDGTIQYGRPIGKVPAANLGMNRVSYAAALTGNFHPGSPGYCGEKPSAEQLDALASLAKHVKTKLPNLRYLIGHRDVARIVATPSDATACPGDDLYALLHGIRLTTGLQPR